MLYDEFLKWTISFNSTSRSDSISEGHVTALIQYFVQKVANGVHQKAC